MTRMSSRWWFTCRFGHGGHGASRSRPVVLEVVDGGVIIVSIRSLGKPLASWTSSEWTLRKAVVEGREIWHKDPRGRETGQSQWCLQYQEYGSGPADSVRSPQFIRTTCGGHFSSLSHYVYVQGDGE